MKTILLMLPILMAASYTVTAQVKNTNHLKERSDLFTGDSVVVYIGIENKFKTGANEMVSTEKPVKDLAIKSGSGFIDISPKYSGVFPTTFKTSAGDKKVILVAKVITDPMSK